MGGVHGLADQVVQRGRRSGAAALQASGDTEVLVKSHLYDLSERQTETFVNDGLLAKCFLGLAVDDTGPDHSTLMAFRRRVMEGGAEAKLAELLVEVVKQARERG